MTRRHVHLILLCAALLIVPFSAFAQRQPRQPLFDLLIRAEPEQLPTYDEIAAELAKEPGAALGFQSAPFVATCLNSSFEPWWLYDGGIVIRRANPADARDAVYYAPFPRILSAIINNDGTIDLMDLGGTADGFLQFRIEAGILYTLFVHRAQPDGIYGWGCGDTDTLKVVLGNPSAFLSAAPPQPLVGERIAFSVGSRQLSAVCLLPSLSARNPDNWRLWYQGSSTYVISTGGMALVDETDVLALLLYNQGEASVQVGDMTIAITGTGEIGARRYSIDSGGESETLDCGAPDETPALPSLTVGVGSANVRVGIHCGVLTALSRGQQVTPLMALRINGEIWHILTRAQLRLLNVLPDDEPNDGPLLDEAFAVVSGQVLTGSLSEDDLTTINVTGTLFLPTCRRVVRQ
jgi:hypothetical protein